MSEWSYVRSCSTGSRLTVCDRSRRSAASLGASLAAPAPPKLHATRGSPLQPDAAQRSDELRNRKRHPQREHRGADRDRDPRVEQRSTKLISGHRRASKTQPWRGGGGVGGGPRGMAGRGYPRGGDAAAPARGRGARCVDPRHGALTRMWHHVDAMASRSPPRLASPRGYRSSRPRSRICCTRSAGAILAR